MDILLRGAGLDDIAARTGDGSLLVVGMYILLHIVIHLFTVKNFKTQS